MQQEPRVWGVDLNLEPTHSAVMYELFDCLMQGQFDPHEGTYNVQLPDRLGVRIL